MKNKTKPWKHPTGAGTSSFSKVPTLFQNRLSLVGLIITLIFFVIEALLFAAEFLAPEKSLYLGLITYIILPPCLLLGVCLIIYGARKKHIRIKRGISPSDFVPFFIDFSIPSHRNAIFLFSFGGSILFLATLVGVYKGYHYLETNEFCGTLCHEVMDPEYTAYQNSAHARVKCVECHIGSGAGWFVKSKLSGTGQIFAVLLQNFPRPIPTPVHNLRPAQETCEQCHWPKKFFGALELSYNYFLTEREEEWDRWRLRMLIKVGGGGHQKEGIHSHMNVNADIYYVAEDSGRQKITWIKTINKEGEEKIFTSGNSKYAQGSPPEALIRKMDCIDCHNRPSHKFKAPYRTLNEAMAFGIISPDIPGIKAKALELYNKEYTTKPAAFKSIEKKLLAYYSSKHSEYYQQNTNKVTSAIRQILDIYDDNFFPEMKAKWDKYPDNIGHLITPGCFRCHDGGHKNKAGEAITRNCNTCHTIIEQGPPGNVEANTAGLEFRHPVDIEGEWRESNCSDCHTGGLIE